MKHINLFLNYGRLTWIFGFITLSYVADFLYRFEDRYYYYGGVYKDYESKRQDCEKYIPSFVNECRSIHHFLSKARFWRTFTDVVAQSYICGRYSCMDYFFSPDISWSFFGKLIKVASICISIWLVLIICKYISGFFTKRNNTKLYMSYPMMRHSNVTNPFIQEQNEEAIMLDNIKGGGYPFLGYSNTKEMHHRNNSNVLVENG